MLLVLTIVQDYAETVFRGSAFYFSESLLFGTVWLLFIPLLYWQKQLLKHRLFQSTFARFLLFIKPAMLHLLLYPALVWILSGALMQHRFAYFQTTQYFLSEYLYIVLLFYAVPVLFTFFNTRKSGQVEKIPEPSVIDKPGYETHLLVPDGYRKVQIAVDDIWYISAKTPYVYIHTAGRKYILKESLRSLEQKLPPHHFVRIHKSAIVHLHEVISLGTRLNGDYDLALKDGTSLRLSRNYASNFKALFGKHIR